MRRAWAVGLIVMLASWSAQARETPGALQGTFLQLWSGHRAWDDRAWERLFVCFKRLHLTELIVQFSQINDLSLVEPGKDRPAVIHTVLRLARRHHVRVWLGLYADLNYFEAIENGPTELGTYFASLRAKSLALAHRIEKVVRHDPQFAGWYLSEEVPDESFSEPLRRRELFIHLRAVVDGLRGITPKRKIGISGFSNGTIPMAAVESFWRELLEAAPIDTVFFQDGIGARKLTPEALPGVLRAVRAATLSQQRELRVVVETFRQRQTAPRFAADPAPWVELRRQLAIARAVTDTGMVAFSVPEYMCPDSGHRARRLFQDYRGGVGLGSPKPTRNGQKAAPKRTPGPAPRINDHIR